MASEKSETRRPVLKTGELWRREDLIAVLKISERTLVRLESAGLQPLRAGTKGAFYLSDDVIKALSTPAEEVPDYLPRYKRKGKPA
jgi:hypothetical protein